MGTCRFLNVLLGLSVVPEVGVTVWGVTLALVVGIYITGVTWLARTEARLSSASALAGAAAVMLAGLLLALAVPALHGLALPADADDTADPPMRWGLALFPYLLVSFAFYVALPVGRALARPIPERVQAAVRRAVLGLVLLDAILASSLAGPLALALALLLLPALYLGRWVYST
jgi:4-hydroxybenzoate polyprenyltransferase